MTNLEDFNFTIPEWGITGAFAQNSERSEVEKFYESNFAEFDQEINAMPDLETSSEHQLVLLLVFKDIKGNIIGFSEFGYNNDPKTSFISNCWGNSLLKSKDSREKIDILLEIILEVAKMFQLSNVFIVSLCEEEWASLLEVYGCIEPDVPTNDPKCRVFYKKLENKVLEQ